MGAYEFVAAEVGLKITPPVLNFKSKGKWIKGHMVMEEGYEVGDIDTERGATLEP